MNEAAELRSQIRHWRRGRATAKLSEVVQDAYIAVFSTLLIGLMVGNVVLGFRDVLGTACATSGCEQARSSLPWLAGAASLLAVLAVARLFGPVFVSPALGSWLLRAPVDRGDLLRPRLLGTVAVAGGLGVALPLLAALLGGFGVGAVLAFVVGTTLLGVSGVGAAALSQSGRGVAARVLVWAAAAVLWTALLVLALGRAPRAAPAQHAGPVGIAVTLGAALLATVLVVLAVRRLGRMPEDRITPGGALAPGLSGALATLDLAMVYDVLLAHRWHAHEAVRSRRGGPTGPWALVWLDLVRLRRSPQLLLVLGAVMVAPYAAVAVGLGRVVLLVAALGGFLATLPLLGALRVVTRTPSILRMVPFPVSTTRLATVAVPVGASVLYAATTVPAINDVVGRGWPDAALVAVAVGGSAAAAAVRWVTGRPPDYTRPLVSTPAGGVPTNLYGSVVRGFDILLVTSAPLLFSPGPTGAAISLGLALVVLGYLTGRE